MQGDILLLIMCVSVDAFEGFTPSTVFTAELEGGRRLLTYENGIRPQEPDPFARFSSRDISSSEKKTLVSPSNAMVLHIPSDDIEILLASHVQLSALSDTLGGVALPQLSTVYNSGMRGGMSGGRIPPVVSQGAYDIAVAPPDSDSVKRAFESILSVNPDFVPPEMSPELIDFYKGLYPGMGGVGLVLAGFNPNRGMESHPIAMSYSQKGEGVFMPGLEEHSGEVPTVGEPGVRDFRVMASPHARFSESEGFGIDPDTVVGFHEKRANGRNDDYLIDEDDLGEIFAGADDKIDAGIQMYGRSSALADDDPRSDWAELVTQPDALTHGVRESIEGQFESYIHMVIQPQ